MSADPAELIIPAPHRVTLTELTAYELTVIAPTGVTLHVFEAQHDAAAFLTPAQIVQLRTDLAHALAQLAPSRVVPGIESGDGRAIIGTLQRCFHALLELDKRNSLEVDGIYRAIVAHVRSARPFVLQAVAP